MRWSACQDASVSGPSVSFFIHLLSPGLLSSNSLIFVHVTGCTRVRNVEQGTKGFRVRKTGLSSTLIKLRYEQ
jgi:hypothetical protein